jgi:hypothetical protein
MYPASHMFAFMTSFMLARVYHYGITMLSQSKQGRSQKDHSVSVIAKYVAFMPFCPSPHPVGRLITFSASPRLDTRDIEPLGHRMNPTRFTTSLHAFISLVCRVSALAHDVATTSRTQCTTNPPPACRDYHLWALTRICPGIRFGGSLELNTRFCQNLSST